MSCLLRLSSCAIGSGFAASLARPGGNITGILQFEAGITGKWLAMLKEIAPRLARAALLGNPKTTAYDYFLQAAEATAPSLAIEVVPGRVENAADIERVIVIYARAEQRTVPATGYHDRGSSRSHHRAGLPTPLAVGLPDPFFRRGGWSHVLWDRPGRNVSACSVLCRSYPAWCQPG